MTPLTPTVRVPSTTSDVVPYVYVTATDCLALTVKSHETPPFVALNEKEVEMLIVPAADLFAASFDLTCRCHGLIELAPPMIMSLSMVPPVEMVHVPPLPSPNFMLVSRSCVFVTVT